MIIVGGIQKITGTSKKTGKPYSGFRLYCNEDRKNVDGHACFDVYVPDNKFPDGLQVGDEIGISYNRFGSVESVYQK